MSLTVSPCWRPMTSPLDAPQAHHHSLASYASDKPGALGRAVTGWNMPTTRAKARANTEIQDARWGDLAAVNPLQATLRVWINGGLAMPRKTLRRPREPPHQLAIAA